uniref:Uncharacterized protein n=1 Tax=Cucumis melo TaxID=3656 RepID=A0A9I9E6H6_CUCME
MFHDKPPTNIWYSSLPAISSSGLQGENILLRSKNQG